MESVLLVSIPSRHCVVMVIRLAGGGHLNYLGTLPVLVLATEAPGSDILGGAPPPPAPLTPVCHPDQSLHQST